MKNEVLLQIAQSVPCTEAEGPGRRFAIWFQGCPLRCPGCCNPEFIPFEGGTSTPISRIVQEIEIARREGIEGITLLGGEPLAHAQGASLLAQAAKELGLTVMVFTGYTLEQARSLGQEHVEQLINYTDILVDGPYLRELPDDTRRWIGSTNQRIHFLTDRYRADDACWKERNTLEIRVRGSDVSVNGFPARQAVGLWKKPKVQERSSG